jgi:soluble lytic murein transglycosylase
VRALLLGFPRVFLLLLVCVLVLGSGARAQEFSEAERPVVQAALAAAGTGDWAQASARAQQVKDPLPLKIVQWLQYTRGNAAARFAEISAFIDANPDWPHQKALGQHAEEALQFESDDTAAAWFKRHPPTSAVGKGRDAEIMLNRGDTTRGLAALRAVWIAGNFTPSEEHGFWTRHGAQLSTTDNWQRLDRLIWDNQVEAARRMLPLVTQDYRALGEARLALATGAARADAMVARVPAALRADPGLVFEQLRWDRKKDMVDVAAQILLAQSGDPVHPAAWWGERQLIARRMLAGGNAQQAYKVVQQHGTLEGEAFAEAEFLSGYIALRFMKDPALAFDDFAHILARVSSASGKARAAYWGGRAAAAQGKGELATKWYAAGADHMTTFYGQLAAHQLGAAAPARPMVEPRPNAEQFARFNAQELVRAARLFLDAGGREHHAKAFLLRQAELAKTPLDYAMLADLAETHGRIDLAIAVARRAGDAGMPLMVHGYPVTTLPSGGNAERPLLLAIVRQESGFETDAVSPVGARGLMQLMPATAASIASKMQLPYSAERLTADALYNVLLGRTYLEQMIDDFGGSYALAIAAYNAGPGRVRQWLHEFGDPRGHDIEMVDWIEMIPFTETRTYVQHVLENLQIYRIQSGNQAAAFSLISDLAR